MSTTSVGTLSRPHADHDGGREDACLPYSLFEIQDTGSQSGLLTPMSSCEMVTTSPQDVSRTSGRPDLKVVIPKASRSSLHHRVGASFIPNLSTIATSESSESAPGHGTGSTSQCTSIPMFYTSAATSTSKSTVPKRSSPLRSPPSPPTIGEDWDHSSPPFPTTLPSDLVVEHGKVAGSGYNPLPRYSGLSQHALQERKLLWLRRHHLWSAWHNERRTLAGAYRPLLPSLRSVPTPAPPSSNAVLTFTSRLHLSVRADGAFPRMGDVRALKNDKSVWMDMRFREYPLNAIRKSLYVYDMDHRMHDLFLEQAQRSRYGAEPDIELGHGSEPVSPTSETEESSESSASGGSSDEETLVGSGSEDGCPQERKRIPLPPNDAKPNPSSKRKGRTVVERLWETQWDARWNVFYHLVSIAVRDLETSATPSSASGCSLTPSTPDRDEPTHVASDYFGLRVVDEDDDEDPALYAEEIAATTGGRSSPMAKFFVYDEERDRERDTGYGTYGRDSPLRSNPDDADGGWSDDEEDYGVVLTHPTLTNHVSDRAAGRPGSRRGLYEFENVNIY